MMRAVCSCLIPAAAAGLALGSAGMASAGNNLHPRTPVAWNDVTCMEFVDRTVDPVYEVHYDLPLDENGDPLEDTDVTPDEVDNSRTHQFFATCRQASPQQNLPSWISTSDVEQTQLKFGEGFEPPPDDEILESSTEWEGCWHRINEDADRRPITIAMASEPVPWDTAAIPVGDYAVWGYTYEPVFNIWTPRIGNVVRVYDGGDPAASGPAAAITTREQTPCVGDILPIEGCVNALAGTTMTGYYAITTGPDASDPDWEPTWVPFAENVEIDGDTFSLPWVTPEEAGSESAMVRIDFTDPNGNTYTAYQMQLNIVLPAGTAGCAADPSDCEGGFIMDPACETSGDDGTGTGDGGTTADAGGTSGSDTDASGSSGGTAEETGDPADPEGCGCQSTPRTSPFWALLVLLGLTRRRWA